MSVVVGSDEARLDDERRTLLPSTAKDDDNSSTHSIGSEEAPNYRIYRAVVACILWACTSSANILIGAYILRTDNFKYPLLMTGAGQIVSSIIAILSRPWLAHHELTVREYCTVIIPLSGMTAIALGLSGAVYLFLPVSFVQMLKAASPIDVMLVMFLFGLLNPSGNLILSVVVISCGCLFAAFGEVSFSLIGVAVFFASDIMDAIRSVWTETLLGRMALMDSLYYIAPASSVWLVLFAAFDEIPRFIAQKDYEKVLAKPMLYLVYSTMGFVVQIMVLAVINETSTLTLKIVGQIKNIATIIGGVVVMGNHVSNQQIFAYCVETVGFWLYQQTMMAERAKAAKEAEDLESNSALLDEGHGTFGAQHRANSRSHPLSYSRSHSSQSTRSTTTRTYSTLSQYSRYSVDDPGLEDRMEGRLQGH
ncbi:hypothetical protein SARC_07258 [Sphaeroforma arctica JP610]|uniref:Sugar phosphate transporter domain-containing protein n=1 Tax=Sphaeroforma arctica JP610 TaxID=667725 RepID=A0A0L0FWQ0_9EUKA|nr:hypothetical protein SARC_07258 [Sphaeroforma arctica JP610]KNC80383.1 hypothetical protein SARC_07258 [Sphaeroforma arctica JP610]|eukprot:XP_014154285.1 hypothetical protein SARC_07258 [Sphaeroforma arctica JP610]